MTIPDDPATHPLVRSDAEQGVALSPRDGGPDAPDRAAALRAAERLVRLASVALRAPMASLAAAEGAGLYVRSCVGFPKDRTPRPGSPFLCPLSRHVFTSGAPLEIADVPAHPLGAGHAGLAALGVRAYLGVPLLGSAGATLGMLSVFAQEQREWSDADATILRDLAALAAEESELRVAASAGAGSNANAAGSAAEARDRAYAASNGSGPAVVEQRGALDEALATTRKMDALGRLAASVAHDFNNHLTAIKGFSQIARHSIDALVPNTNASDAPRSVEAELAALRELRDDVDEITAAAQRASELTARLLAVGRRLPQEQAVFDVNERLASLEQSLRALLGERIELRLAPSATPAFAVCDPSHFARVLRELVLNARDAMAAGGRVTIEVANVTGGPASGASGGTLGAGPYVALSVSDTGGGMDAEARAHLFEPYFTTKDVGKGAGLGLATVYGIARQAHGDVAVESVAGKGTTVRVYLPAAEPSRRNGAGRGRAAALEADGGEGNGAAAAREATVLVVEDEPAVRQLACTMLRRLGHRVVPAADSAEALRLLAALADDGIVPDLLVTDVVLPGMGGPELAKEIARQHARVAVLYMSGYSDDMVERRGELGAGTAFLEKPFSLEQFTARVGELLLHAKN